jgi:hypothetical protein
LNQDDIKLLNNLNRSTASNENEEVKGLLMRKSSGLERFTAEFYQTLKEGTSVLPKLVHKREGEGALLN